MEVLFAREAALEDILTERARQDVKWGVQNHENSFWTAILGEEFGEVCKEVVEDYNYGRLRKELVQVAAVAVAWVECLDRGMDANQ